MEGVWKKFAIQKHKTGWYDIMQLVSNIKKKGGGGGMRNWKIKLELIAASIQSLETTQSDYKNAK